MLPLETHLLFVAADGFMERRTVIPALDQQAQMLAEVDGEKIAPVMTAMFLLNRRNSRTMSVRLLSFEVS